MRNTHQEKQSKIAVVRRVANKLHAAEDAIDKAIIMLSELNRELPEARMDANLSATVGQDAFSSCADALSLLVQSRAKTVNAHGSLAATQADMGLGAYAMGDGWKLFASTQLEVVSEAA
jgi:hypothetical protein